VLVLGWALLPLLAFGTDETLDPARLQLLPLAKRPLMTGLLLGILLAWTFARPLNAFALGEEGAGYVGVAVQRQKIAIITVSTVLTAFAVTLSGLVGFVGLVVPHAMRLLLGPNHRTLLPASWCWPIWERAWR